MAHRTFEIPGGSVTLLEASQQYPAGVKIASTMGYVKFGKRGAMEIARILADPAVQAFIQKLE
jgi:hypothetical protein